MASGKKRFANLLIDLVMYSTVTFIVSFVLAIIFGNTFVIWVSGTQNSYLMSFIIYILYFVFFETFFGQTIGKVFTGTKVVNLDGSKVGFVVVLYRTACRFIPFEPFTFLDDTKGLHDTLTKTKVINL